jgi:hypothetical protein
MILAAMAAAIFSSVAASAPVTGSAARAAAPAPMISVSRRVKVM